MLVPLIVALPNGPNEQAFWAVVEQGMYGLAFLGAVLTVVALYYYEHLTLKEIGRTLGISESRVSQVHTRAMSRLKLRLAKSSGVHEEAA